jgi:2-polyprenyl-6-methoxyphenol hydroxylase-like FAD-dependent oxidoreductase
MFTLRPLLIKALGKGLDDVLDLGSKCIGFDQDADGVTVRLEDGREERGAFLVGADGIDSTIRPRLFPGNDPMYAGYTYIRAYGPPFEHPSFPPNRFALTLGPGKRFGINPAGDYTDWFAVVPTEKADGLDGNGLRRLVLDEFAAFPAGIPEVVEATEGGKIFATNVRHLRPLKQWADGRVVLIGDAAHAPAPDLGRGASEAVVDSFVLTECLGEGDVARGGDPAAALAAFEQRRIRDATKFQASARRIGGQMMWANPVAWRVRDVVMKRIAGPQITKETVAELAGDAA